MNREEICRALEDLFKKQREVAGLPPAQPRASFHSKTRCYRICTPGGGEVYIPPDKARQMIADHKEDI